MEDLEQHIRAITSKAIEAGLDGEISVCGFGETKDEIKLKAEIERHHVTDTNGIVDSIIKIDGMPNYNVYHTLSLMKKGGSGKGGEADIIENGVLAMCVDFDDDQGHKWKSRMPVEPDYVIETSPGHFQCGIVFDTPVSFSEAKPLAQSLVRATNCDPTSADLSHVFRPAFGGLKNRPAPRKVRRGRDPNPVNLRVIKKAGDSVTPVEALKQALNGHYSPSGRRPEGKGGQSPGERSEGHTEPSRAVADLMAALPEAVTLDLAHDPGPGSRSETVFKAVARLAGLGLTVAEIVAVIDAHPGGIGARYQDRKDLPQEVERIVQKTAESRHHLESCPDLGKWPENPLDIFGSPKEFGSPVFKSPHVPAVIANYAADESARQGVPSGAIAMSCLVTCAAAIDDAWKIQPRMHDTRWVEAPRLWCAVIGDPSVRKTAILDSAVGPLQALESKWADEDADLVLDYETAMEHHQSALKRYRSALDKGEFPERPEAPPKPAARQRVVNDTTIEALQRILAVNNGVLVVADELNSWLQSFDRYKAGSDRSDWLSAYNGGKRKISRVGESIIIPNWSASLLGGIQPERLREIAKKQRLADDGLIQRIIPVMVDYVGTGIDRAPDYEAIEAYEALIETLTSIKPEDPDSVIKLSPKAYAHKVELDRLIDGLMRMPHYPAGLRGHLGKWGGIWARLVLTAHIVDAVANGKSPGKRVTAATAEMVSVLMTEYLLPMAVHFYHDVIGDSDLDHGRWIAGHVLAHGLEKITVRDIKRAHGAIRKSPDATIRGVMDVLELVGWVMPIEKHPGLPVTAWEINPHVHLEFGARALFEEDYRQQVKDRIHKLDV